MPWKLDSSYLAWQVSYPLKNCPAVFAPTDLLDELLNKFSYPSLGSPMDFIPRDPSCCSFHTPDSFLPPWYPTLKMTAPLGETLEDLLEWCRSNLYKSITDEFHLLLSKTDKKAQKLVVSTYISNWDCETLLGISSKKNNS